MKRAIAFGLLIFLNFILQTTLFRYIEVLGVKPNTAVLLVVSIAVLWGDLEGAAAGFFAGLLLDLGLGGVVGVFAAVGTLTGWFCGKPFSGFYKENYVFPALLCFAAAIAWEAVYYCARQYGAGVDLGRYAVRAALPGLAYTMILFAPVFMLVFFLNKKLAGKEQALSIR